MSLVSSSIANLINGVSQQPPSLRLASQAELVENCMPSVVDGLRRRPPTEHIGKLVDGAAGLPHVHFINRDTSERYVVLFSNGAVRVFDLDGTEKTVNVTAGAEAYLASASPATDFRAVTVADYTFVVNSGITVALDGTLTADAGVSALLSVKQVDYNVKYDVFIDGALMATYTAPSSGSLSTVAVASALRSGLAGALGAGWTVTEASSSVHVKRNDGLDFTVRAVDTNGGTNLKVAKDTVQRFSDLPVVAPNGFTVRVVGDQASSFDDYYVKFVPNNAGAAFDDGQWEEAPAPGIPKALDADTMPHTLVREANGTFTFGPAAWAERTAGDETSAPPISLVGHKVNDLFFWKGRLGIIGDSNTLMSESGEFFNFWRTTVTTLLDSDPIDVSASHNKVAILRHAVPHSERLLLFSDQTQFSLQGGDILTPKTVNIDAMTEFSASPTARPIGVGKNVFFAVDRGGFSGIREYFIQPDTESNDAADVTAHVPRYLPAGVVSIEAAQNEDLLLVLSASDRTKVFPYRYYWAGDEKLQSAWSTWSFNGATVLGFGFVGSTCYLVTQQDDGAYLSSMRVEDGLIDPDEGYLTHADRRITEADCASVTYDAGTDRTTFVLPYQPQSGASCVVVSRFGAGTVGLLAQGVQVAGTSVSVLGDWSATPVFIGEVYTSRYVFSRAIVKEQSAGGGQAPVSAGRLQLRRWEITYENTGAFEVVVTNATRSSPSVYRMSALVGSAVIGQVALRSGRISVPALGRNDDVSVEVRSSSVLPMQLMAAEWEAFYTTRSARL